MRLSSSSCLFQLVTGKRRTCQWEHGEAGGERVWGMCPGFVESKLSGETDGVLVGGDGGVIKHAFPSLPPVACARWYRVIMGAGECSPRALFLALAACAWSGCWRSLYTVIVLAGLLVGVREQRESTRFIVPPAACRGWRPRRSRTRTPRCSCRGVPPASPGGAR
eukprot:scaffold5104_cov123-Isochrysis_galbana.AAC.4